MSTRYDWTGSQALADPGTTDISFSLPAVTSLDEVSFYATHTYVSDLSVSIVAPDSTTHQIIYRVGGTLDDFGTSAADADRTHIRDDAATRICDVSSAVAHSPGTFKPCKYYGGGSEEPIVGGGSGYQDSPLSVFGSQDAGTWVVRFIDYEGGDTGIVHAVSLFATVYVAPEDSITIDIENTHLDTDPPVIPLPPSTSDFANWKFVLCNSSDLSSLGELKQARQKQLTIELNRPGSLSFTLPIADRDAYLVDPVRTCVLAYRDNILIWSGPVWIVAEKLIEEQVQVTCLGWSEILFHRLIQPSQAPVTYSSVDAGTIAQNLLAFANAQGQTPALAPSSTFISAGTTTASITRTITYTSLQNIGQAIQQLSDIENGFDFYITPGTRVMDIYYPRLGVDQTGILLGAGDVSIKGLAQVGRNIDASRMANRTWVVGAHETGFAEDTTSQSTYIMLEDTYQLTDVTDSTILAAYANAELAVRYLPLVFVEFDVFPAATFRMFRNFNIGDIIYISARKGRMQFTRQAARVFGATITIDDGGVERVSSIKTRLG